MVVIEEVHVFSNDDLMDKDYIVEEEKEEQEQDEDKYVEEEDDVGMEDFDSIEDNATNPDWRSQDLLESRPSFGTPPSRGTRGASLSI